MIQSLDQLAANPNAAREHFGDKPVDLAELIHDMDEHGFDCVKPYGHVADIEGATDEELRAIFDDLRSKIATVLEGKIVGALICRSAGFQEKSGVNTSIPIVFDERKIEECWQDFRAAYNRVRFNPEKKGDKVKSVLMQVLQGELRHVEKTSRTVGTFKWPAWPDFDNPEPGALEKIVNPIAQLIRSIIKRECKNMFFEVRNAAGVRLAQIQTHEMENLERNIEDDLYLQLYHGMPQEVEYDLGLDPEGNVINHDGEILLRVGEDVDLTWEDVPARPVIGLSNEAFVARSHHYVEPDKASIETAKGLTSYLVGGLPPLQPGLRGRMLYYFDPETGELLERINLGHDSTKESIIMNERYYQTHIETLGINEGKVVALPDIGTYGKFHPRLANESLHKPLLDLVRFYAKKKGAPVEVEGAVINGKLHVWQVSESPLPADVITKLSEVPEDRIVYKSEYGRGAISYKGDIIIDDGKAEPMEPSDSMVMGFDGSVTSQAKFIYMATSESVMQIADRHLVQLESHLAGYACQVTFEAAREKRQGGVYYIGDADELIAELAPFIVEHDGKKVIRNICVEACQGGMQIYKI